jgi:hypothetical protein
MSKKKELFYETIPLIKAANKNQDRDARTSRGYISREHPRQKQRIILKQKRIMGS